MTEIICVVFRLDGTSCDISKCYGKHTPWPKECPEAIQGTGRGPIPQEIKDRLARQKFYAYYYDKKPAKHTETICAHADVKINALDVFYRDLHVSFLRRKTTMESYYAGARVDDGESTKYKWVDEGRGVTNTYTLLSSTDSYTVILNEIEYANGNPSKRYIYVISVVATLTEDELKAIAQVQKDNNLTDKLEPAQNFNCKA